MSMKNSSDTIGNRTRDLLACSAAPQPTAPLRAHLQGELLVFLLKTPFFRYMLYMDICFTEQKYD